MIEILLFIFAIWAAGNKNIHISFLISYCFFHADWIVGTGVSNFTFSHNYLDLGILIILYCFYVLSKRRPYTLDTELSGLKNGLKYLTLFYVSGIFIDLVVNNVAVGSVVKVLRLWVLLYLVRYIKYLKKSEVEAFLRYLLIFTIVLSTLFIVEQLFGVEITGARHTRNGTRAPLPWPPTLLVFILLLYNYFKLKFKYRTLFFGVIATNLVLCGSRSYFIGYVLAVLFYMILGRLTKQKVMILSVCVISLSVVLLTDNILTERFIESKSDIESLQRSSNDVEGNLSFRLLMLEEKYDYIMESPQRIIWGLGSVQEKDFPKHIFNIGLINKITGERIQLDTGDIAWTILLIRLGLVGTILYVCFWVIRILSLFWRFRADDLAKGLFAYVIINVCFISFTYPHISNSIFWVLPLLAIRLVDFNSLDSIRTSTKLSNLERSTRPILLR